MVASVSFVGRGPTSIKSPPVDAVPARRCRPRCRTGGEELADVAYVVCGQREHRVIDATGSLAAEPTQLFGTREAFDNAWLSSQFTHFGAEICL